MLLKHLCLCLAFGAVTTLGCGGESNSVISPPEGAREMTDEERAEFNKNAASDMEPVIRD